MMNLKRLLLIIVPLLILSSCTNDIVKEENVTDFFVRTDGYVSESVGQTYELVLTYYCKNGNNPILSADNISCVKAVELEEVTITVGQIQEMKKEETDQYQGYSMNLFCTFSAPGIYELECLDFEIEEKREARFPIGKWQFDIAEDDGQIKPLIYNDFVVTSDPSIYQFETSTLAKNINIEKIYYSKDQYVTMTDGQVSTGRVELKNISAPVYVIRPKIIARIGREEVIFYGTECACGALDVDENDIIASRRYTLEKRGKQ